MSDQNAVLIANFPVRDTTRSKLVKLIYNCILTNDKCILFFANTNFIVTCDRLKSRMINEDIFIVNDGLGIDVARMLLHGRKFKSNLNGTDFMPYLFAHSQRKLRIFLLGGNAVVLQGAAEFVEKTLNHQVVGTCDGYDGLTNSNNLIDTINLAAADVVLVALGNPKQEEWILENYQKTNANLFAGVGGLFDFWSGYKPRAPKWVQKIRMEWLYRLSLEPRRLYKRYTVDIFRFLVICIKYRKQVVK